MPRDREPWVKVKIGARRSGKLAGLPSDTARLGYFYTLLEAKVQRRMGVFDNRAHFVEVLGRFGKHLSSYLEVGLVHEAPGLCAECRRRHPNARKGQIVVHDYLREQRDPTNADRQAAWRESHGEDGDNDDRNDDRNGSDDDDVTGTVTQDVTGTVTAVETATVTPDSRARATTATGTGTTTEGSTRSSTSDRARADVPVDPSDEDEEAVAWLPA